MGDALRLVDSDGWFVRVMWLLVCDVRWTVWVEWRGVSVVAR